MPAILVLTACAASVPERADRASQASASHRGAQASSRPAAVRFDLDNALPGFSGPRRDAALLASRFSASVDGDRLRYRASWSVEPGDVLAPGEGEAADGPATRLGGQQLGQHVSLRLPELAGSPVSLGLSAESRNDLLVTGYRQRQREQATLEWSPGAASVAVQWAGTATPFGAGTALACDLRSTVRLPTHEGDDHSEGLTFSGGVCSVTADGTTYAGVATRTWGMGYAWNRPGRQTEAMLSVIDPAETSIEAYRSIAPGYEFDVTHRREFGPLSAGLRLSLREAPAWEHAGEYAAVAGSTSDPAGALDSGLATQTSFAWNLPYASLSANWATGVDPLWFTPEPGTRRDRFGLALDLSRWAGSVVPDAAPRVAMNWNWSQLRLPGDEITGENALRLDVALHF